MDNNLLSVCKTIEDSNCSLCPELKEVRTRIVTSRGNPNADVVITGQNPGMDEDASGLPFSGRAGQLLDDIIRNAGYNPNEDFFFTNVVLCHSQNNNTPSPTNIRNCSNHFQKITTKFQKFLAIGKTAAEGIVNSWDQEQYIKVAATSATSLLTRGMPKRMRYDKVLFVCYHTSYLLRNGVQIGNTDDKLYKLVEAEIKAVKQYTSIKPTEDIDITSGSLF